MAEKYEKAKTYLEREVRKSNNFVFVSYAHKDEEQVDDTLRQLFNSGLNFWYDVEFEIGDKWYLKACEQLEKDGCVSAIVFVSKNTIISDACHKELLKIKSLNIEKEKIAVIPVLIGFSDIESGLNNVLYGVKNNEIDIKDNKEFLIEEKIKTFREITGGNDTIFATYENLKNGDLKKLMNVFTRLGTVENRDFKLKRTSFYSILKGKNEDNEWYVNLGKYNYEDDGTENDIVWKAIWQDNNIVYLVTQNVIDYVYKDEVDNLIDNILESIEVKDAIENFDILNADDLMKYNDFLGKFIPTDYADTKRAQLLKLNYVRDKVNDNEYKYCNVNGKMYNEINSSNENNYGIRLFLKLNLNKIMEEN